MNASSVTNAQQEIYSRLIDTKDRLRALSLSVCGPSPADPPTSGTAAGPRTVSCFLGDMETIFISMSQELDSIRNDLLWMESTFQNNTDSIGVSPARSTGLR